MNQSTLDAIEKMPKAKQTRYKELIKKLENEPVYDAEKGVLKPYKYWSTHPVPKTNEIILKNSIIKKDPIIEKPKIPSGYSTSILDINSDKDLDELMILLNNHYVGNDSFRMQYTKEHIKLFLNYPSAKKYGNISVKLYHNDKLVGFIGSSVRTFMINQVEYMMAESDFLSLHTSERKKGFVQLLIDELIYKTQQYALTMNLPIPLIGFYTGSRYLPKPFTSTTYYHRPINFEKLYKCGFVDKEEVNNMIGTKKFYDIPASIKKNFRPLREEDIEPLVEHLNSNALEKYDLVEKFNIEDFKYYYLDSPLVHAYVFVDEEDDEIIEDFVALYELHSATSYIDIVQKQITEMSGPKGAKKMRKRKIEAEVTKHDIIKTLYVDYYTQDSVTKLELFQEMARLAKKLDMDVINSLNIFEAGDSLKEYKFLHGSGHLYYYYLNYKQMDLSTTRIGKMIL